MAFLDEFFAKVLCLFKPLMAALEVSFESCAEGLDRQTLFDAVMV
jgi:hypothetical protein